MFLTGSVDPRAALLSRPVNVATLYGKRVAVLLPAQADAVYFIGGVTPLRSGAAP